MEVHAPECSFIVVDDMRPELAATQQDRQTPNIDRIAARGMVFNHAYCQQACAVLRGVRCSRTPAGRNAVWIGDALRVACRIASRCRSTSRQRLYCAALSKVYHKGFEDGRSWCEPHWYPSGKPSTPIRGLDQADRHPARRRVQEYSAASKPDPRTTTSPQEGNGRRARAPCL